MVSLFSINILQALPILTSLTNDEKTFDVLDLKITTKRMGSQVDQRCYFFQRNLIWIFLNHILINMFPSGILSSEFINQWFIIRRG